MHEISCEVSAESATYPFYHAAVMQSSIILEENDLTSVVDLVLLRIERFFLLK